MAPRERLEDVRQWISRSPPILSMSESLELLATGKFSDFTIYCEGVTFPVHKFVLSMRSRYFRTVIDSDFKEGVTSVYVCGEADAKTVAVVIAYLYTRDAVRAQSISDIWPELFSVDNVRMKDQIAVYTLADFFMLDDLKEQVSTRFTQVVSDRLYYLCDKDKHDNRDRVSSIIKHVYDSLCDQDDLLRPSITRILLEVEEHYKPKDPAPVVVISDDESDDSTDFETGEESSGDSDSYSDSDNGESDSAAVTTQNKEKSVGVKKQPLTFMTTLNELMVLAEVEDTAAVRTGRELLQRCKEREAKLEAKLWEATNFAQQPSGKRRRVV